MYAAPSPNDDPLQDSIRLADWIELNLLTEEEGSISISSVVGELADSPPDDSDDSEQRYDQEVSSFRDDGQTRRGYLEDAEDKAEAAFSELSTRAAWLDDCYPLEIESDAVVLDHSKETILLYRFLVLLRARQLYRGAMGDDGEEAGFLFEELVTHALGAYIRSGPSHRVRFGVAKNSRGGGLSLPIDQALQELSSQMFEDLGTVPASAKDDYKADAVAWSPFGDSRPGQLVLIGQAKISEGVWPQSEPAPRWADRNRPQDQLIRFVARPITAVAFPETLSLTSREKLIGLNFSSIPLDRLRLLKILHSESLPSSLLERMSVWAREMMARLH